MIVIAMRDIVVGEEFTVSYGEGYFEEDNRECLCQTCKDLGQNGWSLENQKHFDGSRVRTPGDYECMRAASVYANYMHNSCRVCERHMKLFGYRWPKTTQ